MGTLEGSKKLEYVKIIKEGPSKKEEMIFSGLTFIVSTLLIVFAIAPSIRTVTDISKEIKRKEEISTALQAKLTALTSLDGQYQQNKEIFDDFTLIFPTSKNLSLLLANMDAVVTRNAFVLDSINFSDYKGDFYDLNTTSLEPYAVRLSVSGPKIYLINLLKDIEAMPMFPVIERISYSTETDEGGNISYSIQMRVYEIESLNFYD